MAQAQGFKVYDFDTQLKLGKGAEHALDEFFSTYCKILTLPLELEKQGYGDRVFLKGNGDAVTVEYKADFVAHRTRNVFIELFIEQENNELKDSWAFNCRANFCVIYVVSDAYAFWVPMERIKNQAAHWGEQYDKKRVRNEGYAGIGVAVPVTLIESLATKKFRRVGLHFSQNGP